MQTIYIITGPCGAGKSTTSIKLAESMEQSAYIEGDLINDMIVGGSLPPWESEEQELLTWKNIADMSSNFIKANKNVVIDYIAFPRDVDRLLRHVQSNIPNVRIVYVVLWVEQKELLRRDSMRSGDKQMKGRCLDLIEEFNESGLDERFKYDTSKLTTHDLPAIIATIKQKANFIY